LCADGDDNTTELSPQLDLAVDLSIEYAVSTLAGGERLQPFASYEAAGEVTRAFFLGVGHPDPVQEARLWIAEVENLTFAAIVYPGELTNTAGRRPVILAESWEPGMENTLVVAQEYERLEDSDAELGRPSLRAMGMQLEVGTAPPLNS
jgi:hypothetical protein